MTEVECDVVSAVAMQFEQAPERHAAIPPIVLRTLFEIRVLFSKP